ncbi:MAG: hypothetical protein WBA41_23170 [Rivularia sp. (in: cyanobacteria)]
MQTIENLTANQSQVAHNIAIELVKDNTDVNELGKIISYLRATIDKPNATGNFFTYLKTLTNNGKLIGHSKKTSDYYRSIEQVCKQYLQNQSNPETILQILGWSARLMRYYKTTSIDELPSPTDTPMISERQAEIAEVIESQSFAIDQVLDAKVLVIKGNKVTYEILGAIKLTVKEPKKASDLQEGQTVKVKIDKLKDDGSVKNVKCV